MSTDFFSPRAKSAELSHRSDSSSIRGRGTTSFPRRDVSHGDIHFLFQRRRPSSFYAHMLTIIIIIIFRWSRFPRQRWQLPATAVQHAAAAAAVDRTAQISSSRLDPSDATRAIRRGLPRLSARGSSRTYVRHRRAWPRRGVWTVRRNSILSLIKRARRGLDSLLDECVCTVRSSRGRAPCSIIASPPCAADRQRVVNSAPSIDRR